MNNDNATRPTKPLDPGFGYNPYDKCVDPGFTIDPIVEQNDPDVPTWDHEGNVYPELDLGSRKFRDYHSVNTIQLCELVNDGFPLLMDYNLNNADKKRITNLAVRRYWNREISTSPWEFRQNFNQILNEQYLKYEPLYKLLKQAKDDLNFGGSSENKSRDINSEYPQSQIKKFGQDYASNATDHEDKSTNTLGTLDTLERYQDILNRYDNIDLKILNELDKCFSSLLSSFINDII